MTDAQQLEAGRLAVRGLISDLLPEEQAACYKLVADIKAQVKTAGCPVGTLALALAGIEAQREVT